MKHISRKVLSLLGLSLMLVGCGGNTSSATNGSSAEARTSTSTVQEVKVTRLVVSAKPTKTKYSVGEKFDPTGMVVTAIYSNGIREEV
jgi:ABC-type glycerol-3-phosphate transport system substrate-binding protein